MSGITRISSLAEFAFVTGRVIAAVLITETIKLYEMNPIVNFIDPYPANTRVWIALVGMAVTIARLAKSQVDTLDGTSVSSVAILAGQSLVTPRASALFDGESASLSRVSFFGNVE